MGNKGGKPEFRKTSLVDKIDINEEVGKDLVRFPILAKYSEEERARLGTVLEKKTYKQGENIFEQGEMGHGFFLLSQGEALVHRTEGDSKEKKELGILKPGDYFGEYALLTNQARAATVTAITNVMCYYLDRAQFQQLFSSETLNVQFAKRAAVSAEQTQRQKEYKRPSNAVTEKSGTQIGLIMAAIADNVLFVGLNAEQRQQVVSEMYREAVPAGAVLIKQGDKGEKFYVVEKGNFDILVKDAKVAARGKGECFGELALMYNAPRAATVVAAEASVVWVMHRYTFRRIVASMNEEKYAEYRAFLASVDLLAPLATYEREKIAELLEEISMGSNVTVFEQGQPGTAMYFVKSGDLLVTKDDEEVMRLTKGQYFGERALLRKDVRAATVSTITPVTLLKLDEEAFSMLLGPLEDVMNRKIETEYDVRGSRISRMSSMAPAKDQHQQLPAKGALDAGIKFENLKVLGTLGKGSFGHVQLVQDTVSSRAFALKAVNKAVIVETCQQQHIMSEKNVMASLDHPFIIKLYQTFKDRDRLYLLLEPVLGGELFTLLRSMTMFDTPTTRFYAGSVVLIFEYMHSLDIIYRDLKPENILLDSMGYLKMTDFGFAKKLTSPRTETLCGTPDYLAPEIVSGKGHGKGVDWWTLGILIFEMLASAPPFYDEDPMKIYAKIMAGEINWPTHFSKNAVSLIKKLLHPKATRRLGVVKGGAQHIKEHPWFEGFDFDLLFHRKLKAPIVPQIRSETDLSNFEDMADEEADNIPQYVDDGRFPDWDADF